jgi:hypothetical protein
MSAAELNRIRDENLISLFPVLNTLEKTRFGRMEIRSYFLFALRQPLVQILAGNLSHLLSHHGGIGLHHDLPVLVLGRQTRFVITFVKLTGVSFHLKSLIVFLVHIAV